jgi:hypothetical protein
LQVIETVLEQACKEFTILLASHRNQVLCVLLIKDGIFNFYCFACLCYDGASPYARNIDTYISFSRKKAVTKSKNSIVTGSHIN